MSKIIALWGSPNSGKTTLAVKLSTALNAKNNSAVLCLHCDYETPCLPVLFPTYKAEDLFSIGEPLSKTDFVGVDVLKTIITTKGKWTLGFMGFKDGENKYSYPAFDEIKARNLLTVLRNLSNYVIVDCTSNLDNPLSRTALEEADIVIRTTSPDLKSISFYSSQIPLYTDPKYNTGNQIQCITVNDADLFVPLEDIKAHYKNVAVTIPYCRNVKQQILDGTLAESVSDRKYNDAINTIIEKVV